MKPVLITLFLLQGLRAADSPQLFPLEGPWKVQAGDDPRWAEVGFDDSNWSDCTPLVPGKGFRWYRRMVRIPAELAGPVSLWFPYLPPESEVYVNGHLVLQYGVPGRWLTARRGPVPASELQDIHPGDQIQIALRTRTGTALAVADWRPPWLGSREGIGLATRSDLLERLRAQTAWLFTGLLNLLFAVGALLLWRRQKEQPIYFWFALTQLSGAAWSVVTRFGSYCLPIPERWTLPGEVFWGVELVSWFFLFRGEPVWTGLRDSLRRFWPFAAIASVDALANGLASAGLIERAWPEAESAFLVLPLIFAVGRIVWRDRVKVLLFVAWLVYVLGTTWGSIRTVLAELILHQQVLDTSSFVVIEEPFKLNLNQIGSVFSVIAMGGILLARFVSVARERQSYEGELEAARQVQELLVPSAAAQTPGFEVESACLPAQRVGGDFFQILSVADGVLVCVGDVSGKGLRAAMIVSLVVGALRNRRSDEPVAILAELNMVLAGQTGGGFVTCCCARFDSHGGVTIANAGHPAPYCDGRELNLDAGLPLGIAAGVEYAESVVQGERFTFVSDGVVEAENAQRELFGFDRTLEISIKSAQEIADAAQAWGQTDDITVVTVRRHL